MSKINLEGFLKWESEYYPHKNTPPPAPVLTITKRFISNISSQSFEALEAIFNRVSSIEIKNELPKTHNGINYLHMAVLNPDIRVLNLLLEITKKHEIELDLASLAPNQTSRVAMDLREYIMCEGETPLITAFKLDMDREKIKLLLEHNVDHIPSDFHFTASQRARKGRTDFLTFMLDFAELKLFVKADKCISMALSMGSLNDYIGFKPFDGTSETHSENHNTFKRYLHRYVIAERKSAPINFLLRNKNLYACDNFKTIVVPKLLSHIRLDDIQTIKTFSDWRLQSKNIKFIDNIIECMPEAFSNEEIPTQLQRILSNTTHPLAPKYLTKIKALTDKANLEKEILPVKIEVASEKKTLKI